MAVVIRLRRMGNPKKPFFRIVAADSRFATDGRILEELGWYDPKVKGTNYKKLDRVDYWQKTGARLSDTINTMVKKARAASPGPA
jgi:small subunit ribosomal protein S16